jgi:hypothetical protein
MAARRWLAGVGKAINTEEESINAKTQSGKAILSHQLFAPGALIDCKGYAVIMTLCMKD